MIASPSDVPQERRVIRDVIDEWNAIHAEDRKLVLMPLGWETHSSPDMGDRPQAIINRQLLKNADLLIAVFWTRLGSPTGIAPSGTVEEIEEHLAAGKPAMIYFSSAPVRLDSVDNDQYSALKAFKESCKQRGLVEEYEDLTQFRAKFSRQLAQTVIRRFTSTPAGPNDIGLLPEPEPVPALSDAARELLVEASQDANGVIMRLGALNGSHVQTNNRNFVESGDARSAARWRGAVDELYRLDLIEDRAGKGEVFYITDEGYRVADLLRQQ
jgi:hypothetical protein